MSQQRTDQNPAHGRAMVIGIVKTPLNFFVLLVLVVEALLFALAKSSAQTNNALVGWMIGIIVLLIVVVTLLAFFRLEALTGIKPTRQLSYSLHVGPPKEPPNFDITIIDWDDSQCFIYVGNNRRKVSLVASSVGASFQVKIEDGTVSTLADGRPVRLELKDQKGNRWRVKSFYPFEKVLPLTPVEDVSKIINDYSQA
jgi:hypothetical protein